MRGRGFTVREDAIITEARRIGIQWNRIAVMLGRNLKAVAERGRRQLHLSCTTVRCDAIRHADEARILAAFPYDPATDVLADRVKRVREKRPSRPCMRCRRSFVPKHRFNRLCWWCAKTADQDDHRFAPNGYGRLPNQELVNP